jgi:Peptidase inhibitor family I36
MKRTIALTIGALSLSLMGLVAVGPTAQADDGACPSNRFCLFEHDNYEGGRAVFSGTTKHLGDHRFNNGHTVGDNASSMINNTGHRVALYEHGDCHGQQYNARAHSHDTDFSNNDFDNEASCLVFIP